MTRPLVSIITPTWQRHDLLLTRCIPSVQRQDYPNVEHVIVSDGPDQELRNTVGYLMATSEGEWRHPIRFFEISERVEEVYGCRPRRFGIEKSAGGLIGYVDDDDSLRPDHVSSLVKALESDPEAGFARSLMRSHLPEGPADIGYGDPAFANIGTPMILHRRELLEIATWGAPSEREDWELVSAWLRAGVNYVPVDKVTIDVWPSRYRPATS